MENLKFEKYGRYVTFPKKSIIFIQKDSAQRLFLLKKGIVKLLFFSNFIEGAEIICYFMHPGMFFGESAILLNKPYGITACSVTDCEVIVFENATTFELIKTDPDFALALTSSMSQVIWYHGYHLLGNSLPSSLYKVAYALLNLCYQMKPNTDRNIQIELSHEELASFTSLTRVTVTKSLNKLEKEKLIQKRRNYIIINNKKDLKNWLAGIKETAF
jgi:CRP/FNR family transcriptional regulator